MVVPFFGIPFLSKHPLAIETSQANSQSFFSCFCAHDYGAFYGDVDICLQVNIDSFELDYQNLIFQIEFKKDIGEHYLLFIL